MSRVNVWQKSPKINRWWVNVPFVLQCLSYVYWRFNFKIPWIVFGLSISLNNPQTHLVSRSGNAHYENRLWRSERPSTQIWGLDFVCLSKIRNSTFQSLKGSQTQSPPLPLQDVAGVNTAPITAVVTAGKTHVRARAPAAVCGTLPVASVVPQSWNQTHNLKKGSFPS